MPYFNHTVCIALEHLSAREHLYNLSSLMGFSFVFQGRTHREAFTGAAPPSPASTAGVLDDVHQGWQDVMRTMASLQHFSSPLIPFFLLQPLRTQSTDTGVCTNNSQICSCSVPRKNIPFWCLYLHMNLCTIQSQIRGSRLKLYVKVGEK